MNIIKTILKTIAKIIHFVPATEEEKIEYAKRQRAINTYSKSNDTIINPATGLPMVGCLDVNGNSFGSNSSYDHYRRSSEDSYRSFSSTNNSSNYDPFTNRYH
jgi:glutaredoxin 2